ncbi:MAG: DUF3429 domain-containing protein [Yoonia sp.]|jgi:hypothetical protein|nr:DUF3429 domain-containing protein [Yoonia sp.]
MMQIPRAPLLLGLAGLIPFIWGAMTILFPDLAIWGQMTLGGRFIGPYIQLFYGAIILAFMSGVLWGFAAKTDRAIGYILSVIPALWAFLMTGGGPVAAAMNLIVGFLGLLMLDWQFWRWGLTPPWWMQLRILLTAIVAVTLLPIVI